VSVLVGVGCALPSIYQLLRERHDGPHEALKEGGRTTSSTLARGWVRNALVIAEVALALVLLVAAGVMVRTFQHMLALDAGFDPKNLLTMDVALSATQYREPARITQFYEAALRGLDVIPGVEVAAASGGVGTAITFFTGRRGDARPGEPRPYIQAVTPRYFQTMRIPIVQGRPIGEHDEPEAMPVVVLSESVVRHYWPDSSPIGEQIRFGGPQSRLWTVIGVCGDVRDWFGGDPRPAAYVSHQQWSTSSMTLWLRTRREPMESARNARAAVRAIDASQPVFNVKSMEQALAEQTSGVRMAARLMGSYAGISLLLALMGTYAVGAFFVVQRTQEFGVRVALGATRWNIVRLVLTDTASTSAIGLAVGLLLAVLLTQIMSRVLYNVVVIEPMAFVMFTSLLAASVLVAGYIPARRAGRVDPVIALRNE
jgi:predicted permease